MKNNLILKVCKFEDESSGRYWHIRLVGTPQTPEWVASDIVPVLYPEAKPYDYPNYFAQIPAEWKSQKKVLTSDGEQFVSTLYEPGLYYLIAHSNNPLAIRFQKWVSDDILPSIRPNDSYSIGAGDSPELLSTQERLESIRLGMDLLYELGGIDERTRLALREQVREILLEDPLTNHNSSKEEKSIDNNRPLELFQSFSKPGETPLDNRFSDEHFNNKQEATEL